MKIRTRFFLLFLLLVGLGFYQFVQVLLRDLRPRALATMEESMVETTTLLASMVSSRSTPDQLSVEELDAMLELAVHWNMRARIYEMEKTHLKLRIYVTDAAGIVVYDSADPSAVGEDYSQWNDVYLTLRGSYGARATRADPEDPTTSILHVASPILKEGRVLGVLTLAKPAASVEPFHRTAKRGIVRYGIGMAVLVITLGLALSIWITRPIEALTRYALAIRDGRRPPALRTGKNEMGRLAASFEEMREALEGKAYVEHYIETLTHEMKSPLSAIRGAGELLEEDMPPDQRIRFLGNIRKETERLQLLVDRLLELSALERKKEVVMEEVVPDSIVKSLLESVRPQLEAKAISLQTDLQPVPHLLGECFLIQEAILNLLQNAIDFTPPREQIRVSLESTGKQVFFKVHNTGSSIPDFARGRIFERFYSLARPDTGRKSSGIGLTLVKQIAELHRGSIQLENQNGGVTATLTLPV